MLHTRINLHNLEQGAQLDLLNQKFGGVMEGAHESCHYNESSEFWSEGAGNQKNKLKGMSLRRTELTMLCSNQELNISAGNFEIGGGALSPESCPIFQSRDRDPKGTGQKVESIVLPILAWRSGAIQKKKQKKRS